MTVRLDALNQTFVTKEPLRIGYGGGPGSEFHGSIDDVRVYNRCLDPAEAAVVASDAPISQLVRRADAGRSGGRAGSARACFLEVASPDPICRVHERLVKRRRALVRFEESLPTVMVMQELPMLRENASTAARRIRQARAASGTRRASRLSPAARRGFERSPWPGPLDCRSPESARRPRRGEPGLGARSSASGW